MQTKESIQQELDELIARYGEWSYDIPLPFGIWTKGNLKVPHTRLKRVVQIVNDLSRKPLSECSILDLGCLDGIFSIEFAQHGASTIGVDVRETNIKRAIFCKEALELENLGFHQADVRNITLESYGTFDAILCSGLLYHLQGTDAANLINTMYEMVRHVVIIDTQISLLPVEPLFYNGREYWGDTFREYADNTPPESIEKANWSSADNPTSFWFTRPSLINLLSDAGFSSVYECFTPTHFIPEGQNFKSSGIEAHNRCTFVAIKDDICQLTTSPSANDLHQNWPEHSLSYAANDKAPE